MLRVQIKVEQQTERGTRQLSHSVSNLIADTDLNAHGTQTDLQQQMQATLAKAVESLTNHPLPSSGIDRSSASNLREFANLIEANKFVVSMIKSTDQQGRHFVQLTLDPTKQ